MSAAFFAAVVAAGGAALRFLVRRASPSPQTSSISDIHVGIAGDAGAGLLLLLPPAPSAAMDMQVAEIEPAVEASRESKAEEEALEVVQYVGEHDEEGLEVEQYVGEHDEEGLEVEQYVGEHDEEALEVEQYVGEHDEEGSEPEPIPAMKDSSIAVNQPRYEADHLILMPVDMDSEYPTLKCSEKDSNTAMNQPRYEADHLILMPVDMDSDYPALKCSEKDSCTAMNQPRYEADHLILMPVDMDSEYPTLKCSEKDSSTAMNQSRHEVDDSILMPVDMGSEYPVLKCSEKDSSTAVSQARYEVEDLISMPDHYDPARENDYEFPINVSPNIENENEEELPSSVEEVPTMTDTGKKSKVVRKGLEKRRELIPAWKSSTLVEKQKRAEEVRAYKADLQNQKKEQEEEGVRRLEALKREREKRNTARISPLTPKQRRASLSPTIFSSPLPNLSTRTCCSIESCRANDTSNGLSCSISSLAELKKEAIHSKSKADLSRIKRLAEPKGSNMHNAASGKPKKSASKESSKASGSKNSARASSMQARKTDDSHVDDSPVLDPEKTVVMVESVHALALPSPIVAHVSESELNVHLNPLYFLPEPGDF